MFCPNCGANLPDGTAFCGNCGASQKTQQPPQQAPAQQPVYQAPPQPQYQPPVYQPQPVYRAPAPISKKEYLATKASNSVKQSARLVMITFILSLVLIVASVIAPLAMPFFDIPAMNLILTAAEADPDELVEEMEQSYEEAEYKYDIQKSAMSKSEREDGKKLLEGMEALIDNFSILNFNSLVNLLDEVGDDYLGSDDMEDVEEISQIMSVVIGVVIGFFVLPLLFTVLGGLNKSTGLTIAALIFTAISQLILSGLLWVVLSLAVNIFQAVQCSKIQNAYQNHRLGRA